MSARELIARELARSGEANPTVVARRLLPKLKPAEREEVLLDGLVQLTHQAVIQSRQIKRSGTRATAGPSRWKIAMPERVYVGEWKLLENCGLDDLRYLAADYRMRAEQMEAKALEYERLAGGLERSGAATVGEMRARTGREVAA